MKKLMTLMLGLSLALGAVSITFGDEPAAPPKQDDAKTKKKGGKKGSKKEEKKDEAPAPKK